MRWALALSIVSVLVSVSLLGQDATLEHASQVNLERAANLPNFVASHWLPMAADFIWHFSNGEFYRTTVEYRNHRHFKAATNITFQ